MPSRVDHKPTGKVCTRCGLPSSKHRGPRDRTLYMRSYNAAHRRVNPSARIIGIDGEGQGRGPHRYTYLAAADESAGVWTLDDGGRALSARACFDFLLRLPTRALIFGFAFLYDLTKIIQDLPDHLIYLLMHEERRAYIREGRVLYRSVQWRAEEGEPPYILGFMNRKFSVRRLNRRAVVWDVFAFFQTKFTKALEDWSILSEADRERMAEMKDQRGNFDQLSAAEVQAYCQTECRSLATLGRKLLEAHTDAGLSLRTYYGAGSTGAALLDKFGIREKRGDVPEAMREPLACAFFGGRFENRVIGPVNGVVHNHDISSAYPYQCSLLPCLLHGRWQKIRCNGRGSDRALTQSTLALIRWRIGTIIDAPWGVLPVRKADGTIAFPLGAVGGWTWKAEFEAARRLNEHVEAIEAWVYQTDCDCPGPFKDLPWYYNERCRIGKEGPGKIYKLGPNSVYGKLAQSRGLKPPYQSWVWAGNITSGTRAQLLDAIAAAKDPSNVLMLATDGVWSREKLSLPDPLDTGTKETGKPLGGWETKSFASGVFAVRPGIYFPLNPSKTDLEKVRARGLGRKVLYAEWQRIVAAFEAGEPGLTIDGVVRFIGAKSGVTWSAKTGAVRSPHYGEWIKWPIQVNFDPRPKRQRDVGPDGSLSCWRYFDVPSFPYEKAVESDEAKMLKLAQLIAEEQPDFDFAGGFNETNDGA